jgi:hypothetical protein
MRWLNFLLLPLLCLALTGGASNKKPKVTVRLFSETNAMDTDKFATPIDLRYPPRKAYLSKVPHVSEYDIQSVYAFTGRDGTMGCAFKLDRHGAIGLDTMSVEKRGQSAVIMVNGRNVIDVIVDRRISDGILTIPFGLTQAEVDLITKQWPSIKAKAKSSEPTP